MEGRPPLTDSPWFWALVFSLMGLLALVTISGQYGKRQSRLERQYQARERVAAAGPEAATQTAPRPYATADNTLIPLWPLAVVLGAIAIWATTMLVRGKIRGGGPPGSPAHGGKPSADS